MSKFITMPLEEYEELLSRIKDLELRKDSPKPDIEDITFLSARLYGHLFRAGIKNVAELEDTRKGDWLRIPGLGKKTWTELKQLMGMYGLRFKE